VRNNEEAIIGFGCIAGHENVTYDVRWYFDADFQQPPSGSVCALQHRFKFSDQSGQQLMGQSALEVVKLGSRQLQNEHIESTLKGSWWVLNLKVKPGDSSTIDVEKAMRCSDTEQPSQLQKV
jgi:hypothetical protein